MEKNSLRVIIAIILFVVNMIVLLLSLESGSFAHTIINRGSVSNYSLYGEYKTIVQLMDYSQYIGKIFVILFLVALFLYTILKLISVKTEKLNKTISVLSWAVLVTSIVSLTAMVKPAITVITGVDVQSCWCGPDYVKIENR